MLPRRVGALLGHHRVPAIIRRGPTAPPRDVRLIAPPASGKTAGLIERVLSRLREGADPARILVLARGDDGAAELRSRLDAATGPAGLAATRVVVDTLPRYAYRLLHERFPHEYRPIVPDATRARICGEVLAALGATSASHAEALPDDLADERYLALFALLKQHGLDPRDVHAQLVADVVTEHPTGRPFLGLAPETERARAAIQALYWLFRAYDLALRNELSIDREDRLLRLYACLLADADQRARLQDAYDDVLVDDFHDLTRLDFMLVKLLGERANLFVAGDDDQPIDRVAGCSSEWLVDLAEHLGRRCRTAIATEVPDCPADVVATADRLIGYNVGRISKQLTARSTATGGLRLLAATSPADQARLVVEALPGEDSPAAVLYRSGATCALIQLRLLLADRSYAVDPADDVVASGALEGALALLRLRSALAAGAEPARREALLALRALFPGADEGAGEPLEAVVAGDRFLVAMDQQALAERVPEAGAAVGQLLAAASPGAALMGAGARAAGADPAAGAALSGIAELAGELDQDPRRMAWTLEEMLSRGRRRDTAPTLRLLRYEHVHGGRWHTVVMTDCNEGVMPGPGDAIADERRRVYNAMLRASACLAVGYVNAPDHQPSRFLFETGIL